MAAKTKAAVTKIPVQVSCESDIKTFSARVRQASEGLMTKPKNPTEAAIAVGHRNLLKSIGKELKEKKEAITKPMNEALKRVRELFKEPEERIEEAVAQIDKGLSDFHRKAQEEIEAKQAELEERFEDGEISETKMNRILGKTMDKAGAAVVPTRKVKEVKVVDESKVPERYWVLDMQAIRRDALDGMKIPGVVVEEVDQIYVKKV